MLDTSGVDARSISPQDSETRITFKHGLAHGNYLSAPMLRMVACL